MAKITLNVNNEIIDEYIEHVKYFNLFFDKRHDSETYLKKAMEHQKKDESNTGMFRMECLNGT